MDNGAVHVNFYATAGTPKGTIVETHCNAAVQHISHREIQSTLIVFNGTHRYLFTYNYTVGDCCLLLRMFIVAIKCECG